MRKKQNGECYLKNFRRFSRHFAVYFNQITETNFPSLVLWTMESTLCNNIIRCFKIVLVSFKNTKYRVSQSQLCYLHTETNIPDRYIRLSLHRTHLCVLKKACYQPRSIVDFTDINMLNSLI